MGHFPAPENKVMRSEDMTSVSMMWGNEKRLCDVRTHKVDVWCEEMTGGSVMWQYYKYKWLCDVMK